MSRVAPAVRRVLSAWMDERTPIFVAISAGWFLSIGVRMAYPVLLPSIREYFDLSLTIAGLLLTVLWLAYAVGQVPGGAMADRFGEGITVTVSMAIAGITIVLIVLAESTLVLFVATGMLGLAIALFGVVRLTALADVYPDQVGTIHGFLGAVGDIGSTLLPPLVGFIAALTIWQLGLGILAPIFFVVTIALWVYVPARTSGGNLPTRTFSRSSLQQVTSELRQPPLVLATGFMVIGFAISQAFLGFYPTYLIEEKGIPDAIANALFASYFALGILLRPIAGNAYDRIGARRTLLSVTVVSGIGFGILPFIQGTIPLIAITALIGFKATQGTVVMAYMTVSLSPSVQNTGLGVMRTIFFTVGALSPLAFGAIADFGFFDEAFLLLAVLSVVAIGIALRLPPVGENRSSS